MKKSLNDMAVETFQELMKLSDDDFFAYFSKIKPSDLSETLLYSGMFDSAANEAEVIYGDSTSYLLSEYDLDITMILKKIEGYSNILNEASTLENTSTLISSYLDGEFKNSFTSNSLPEIFYGSYASETTIKVKYEDLSENPSSELELNSDYKKAA